MKTKRAVSEVLGAMMVLSIITGMSLLIATYTVINIQKTQSGLVDQINRGQKALQERLVIVLAQSSGSGVTLFLYNAGTSVVSIDSIYCNGKLGSWSGPQTIPPNSSPVSGSVGCSPVPSEITIQTSAGNYWSAAVIKR